MEKVLYFAIGFFVDAVCSVVKKRNHHPQRKQAVLRFQRVKVLNPPKDR